MNIAMLTNRKPREKMLAECLRIGMLAHNDILKTIPYDDEPFDIPCDAVAFVGVKCREWVQYCRRTGKKFIYMDKGYYYPKETHTTRRSREIISCWRISVDETQPLEYLTEARHSPDRWGKFGVWPKPWREPTKEGYIVIAGSSPKYHLFNGLAEPTAYYAALIKEIRRYTDRPIHYRPKPSWTGAVPIDDSEFVNYGSFEEVVEGAHVVVTHGSNASLIAMLVGVPSIVTGNGVMRPISSTELSDIENPRRAAEQDRRQLLANLAWSQFTLEEFRKGLAWHHVKTMMLSG